MRERIPSCIYSPTHKTPELRSTAHRCPRKKDCLLPVLRHMCLYVWARPNRRVMCNVCCIMSPGVLQRGRGYEGVWCRCPAPQGGMLYARVQGAVARIWRDGPIGRGGILIVIRARGFRRQSTSCPCVCRLLRLSWLVGENEGRLFVRVWRVGLCGVWKAPLPSRSVCKGLPCALLLISYACALNFAKSVLFVFEAFRPCLRGEGGGDRGARHVSQRPKRRLLCLAPVQSLLENKNRLNAKRHEAPAGYRGGEPSLSVSDSKLCHAQTMRPCHRRPRFFKEQSTQKFLFQINPPTSRRRRWQQSRLCLAQQYIVQVWSNVVARVGEKEQNMFEDDMDLPQKYTSRRPRQQQQKKKQHRYTLDCRTPATNKKCTPNHKGKHTNTRNVVCRLEELSTTNPLIASPQASCPSHKKKETNATWRPTKITASKRR